ncbi:MAG: cation-translocating P-type ATPase, partial [Cyclobacteriaceae bacterium]|nr:cation-translocating P-type ATPase [Cyclobacteriaceae bacterium]
MYSPAKLTKQTFPVLEMTCAACAVSVESMLKSVKGVKSASVNYPNQSASVEYDGSLVTPIDLQGTVRSIGYDLVVDEENAQVIQEEAQQNHYQELKGRTIWASLLSLPLVIIGMLFMDWPYGSYVSMVLAAPVVFYFGRSFFVHAWKQARNGKANMDTLVALSTGIAYAFSVFNTFN